MAKIITKGLIGTQDLNLGTGTFTRATSTGGTQTLNQINLASFSPLASVSLTGQTAAVGSALLYAVPASGAGLYRVTTHLLISTANAASDVITANIASNNGIISQSFVTGVIDSLLSAGNEYQSSRVFYSAASQNINYSTSIASALGTGVYAVRFRLEYLG